MHNFFVFLSKMNFQMLDLDLLKNKKITNTPKTFLFNFFFCLLVSEHIVSSNSPSSSHAKCVIVYIFYVV